jgi:uncharacterized protein
MKCPICNKETVDQYRPFCSDRCKLIDLGSWAGGDYRVPTKEVTNSNGNVEDEE